jgi:hypothetical protein
MDLTENDWSGSTTPIRFEGGGAAPRMTIGIGNETSKNMNIETQQRS